MRGERAKKLKSRLKLRIPRTAFRSAITNGTIVLEGVDHRSVEMRRLRDLVAVHTSDLGGADNISHAEGILMRRAAMITLQCEKMERRWGVGQNFEATPQQFAVYRGAVEVLRRLFETLGLQRRVRHNKATLREYLRDRQRAGEGISLDNDNEAEPEAEFDPRSCKVR